MEQIPVKILEVDNLGARCCGNSVVKRFAKVFVVEEQAKPQAPFDFRFRESGISGKRICERSGHYIARFLILEAP